MQSPFYEELEESTKQAIKEQCDWFDKLAKEYPEEYENYQAMKRGAEMVLELIKTDGFSKAGTANWLSRLDYSQLVYARDEAARMIKKKDEEEKIQLWQVYSENSYIYHFKDYAEASKKSLEILAKDFEENPEESNALVFKKVFVRESEVEELLNVD